MTVITTYRCWGCGSEKEILEQKEPHNDNTTIYQVRWNVCPNCIEEVKIGEEKEEVV